MALYETKKNEKDSLDSRLKGIAKIKI